MSNPTLNDLLLEIEFKANPTLTPTRSVALNDKHLFTLLYEEIHRLQKDVQAQNAVIQKLIEQREVYAERSRIESDKDNYESDNSELARILEMRK